MKNTTKKNNENIVNIRPGIFLNCLCEKHDEDSQCEVHLRRRGEWKEPTKEQKEDTLKQILEVLKDMKPAKEVAPPMNFYPNCAQCGAYLYPNIPHNCYRWGGEVTCDNNTKK